MRYLLACAAAVAACAVLLANESVSPPTAQHAQEWKCTGNPDIPWDQQITNCTDAIQSGRYSGAEIAPAYYNRGIAYHRGKRDLDRAMADYDEAIRLDPGKPMYYNNRAVAYRAKGELDRAVADYDHAIRLDPEHASAYLNRANIHGERGELDLAIADYTAAIGVDPKYALAYRNRGEAYQAQGELARAIADYSAAIGIAPKNEASFQFRGRADIYAGMLPEALADLNRASELDPKDPYTALWLDIVNKRSNLPGRLAEAEKQIDATAWPAPVIRLYLGQLTAGGGTRRGRGCEPAHERAKAVRGEFLHRGARAAAGQRQRGETPVRARGRGLPQKSHRIRRCDRRAQSAWCKSLTRRTRSNDVSWHETGRPAGLVMSVVRG
jgi:tetratricopeptide (TPR) repeat protein